MRIILKQYGRVGTAGVGCQGPGRRVVGMVGGPTVRVGIQEAGALDQGKSNAEGSVWLDHPDVVRGVATGLGTGELFLVGGEPALTV